MNIVAIACFLCSKTLERLHVKEMGEDVADITADMWNEGSSIEISGCYGSNLFDGRMFHGLICDSCLKTKLQNLYEVESVHESKKTYNYIEKPVKNWWEEIQGGP